MVFDGRTAKRLRLHPLPSYQRSFLLEDHHVLVVVMAMTVTVEGRPVEGEEEEWGREEEGENQQVGEVVVVIVVIAVVVLW